MAELSIYRRNDGVSNRYARFPEDFQVVATTSIDDDVLSDPRVGLRRWSLQAPTKCRTKYAKTTYVAGKKCSYGLLHRVVWEIKCGPIPEGYDIDHIDRNGLNNKIENLRLAKRHENLYNSSKSGGCSAQYKGVAISIEARRKYKFEAYIKLPLQKKLGLSRYLTAEEAAYAYNVACNVLRGEFGLLNEIPEGSVSPERQAEIRSRVEQKLAARGLLSETTSA